MQLFNHLNLLGVLVTVILTFLSNKKKKEN